MFEAKQVTIIGTGLLGASLALALRGRGYAGRIVGVGRHDQTLEQARGLGCFDHLTVSTGEALGMARGVGKIWKSGNLESRKSEGETAAASQPAALGGDAGGSGDWGEGHLVVVAAPLGHFREIFVKIAQSDDDSLIVTDVGSTKVSVCALARELLPDPGRFVGAHPMAGSEQQGPMAADGELFEGKPCVVTPVACGHGAGADVVEVVESMWQLVGMRPVRMSPKEHDKAVAVVSHLPHAVAALLVNMAKGDALGIASTGFADTTRIAAGDPGLWVDIFENNKDAVACSVDQMIEALGKFREVLQSDDGPAMLKLLENAKRTRDVWGGSR